MFEDDQELQDGAQLPLQEAAPTAPQPDLLEEFQKKVLEQFKTNTPEEIYKRKLDQYFSDLGVTQGTKKAKFSQYIDEFGRAARATDDKPYVPLKDRLRKESENEYKTSAPGIRAEVGQILTQRKADADRISREKVQGLKNEELRRKTESAERIAKLKDASANKIIGADNLLKEERTRALKAANDFLVKNPGYNLWTPERKNAELALAYKAESGEDYGELLKTVSDFKNANASPSTAKSVASDLDEQWEQTKKRLLDVQEGINKFKKVGTGSGAGGTFRFLQTNETDAQGNLIPGMIAVNPKTLEQKKLPGFNPRNQKQLDIDQAANIGEVQGLDAAHTTLGLIASNRAKDVLGVGAGNPISKLARAIGWSGDGTPSAEVFRELSSKNAALQHTKTMFGGRFPVQAANNLEKIVDGSIKDPKVIFRTMASLVYSIQIMREVNKRNLDPKQIDTNFTSGIDRMIESTLKKAEMAGATGVKANIKLPDITALFAATTAPAKSEAMDAAGAEDRLNQKLGRK